MKSIKRELSELLRKRDLLRAALLLGKIEEPELESEDYSDRVLSLAAGVWHEAKKFPEDRILQVELINRALFEDFGIIGKGERTKNVIDDPSRFYLHRVLDAKLGSPLAITLLYCAICDQLKIPYECVALPSNYFIRVHDSVGDFFVEPYDSGKILSSESFQSKFRTVVNRQKSTATSLYERLGLEQLIGRVLQQLKHIHILKGNALTALRAVEFLAVVFPKSKEIPRDRGILYCEMEYFSKAVENLEKYLSKNPGASDIQDIRKLTQMLKGYREVVN